MIKYFKTGPYINSKSIWLIELDTENEKVFREIEFDQEMNIIRKAPSKDDNYGCFTDNLNVIVKGQKPRYKETIIIEPDNEDTEEKTKEEFEKYWNKEYTFVKKKGIFKYIFILIIIVVIVLFILF